MLAKLQLDPARRALISGFVDAYLPLTIDEQQVFDLQLSTAEPEQQERVMEIVTSWMRQGIEQGIEQGRRSLILRLLAKQVGTLEPDTEARIHKLSGSQLESLAEALLDFSSRSDLTTWLDAHP